MSDAFTLDATTAPAVVIRTKAEDGTVAEHHFEVVTFNKQRLDATNKYAKQIAKLQAKKTATAEDALAMAAATAAALDQRVRSTNGPVTITSLWDDGLIGIEHLRLLGERLNADPPA